jgi:hypothetical protein
MSVTNSGPRAWGPQTPTDILQLRAAEQRRRLQSAAYELRDTLRERVDVRRNAREHLLPAAGAAAVFGLILGYGFGGFFAR